MKSGIGTIKLNKQIREEMQRANDRAGRLGLHIVHFFFRDVINGELCHRSGYFEAYSEAEYYAIHLRDNLNEHPTTALILLDNDIFYGKFLGDDAKVFMADDGIKEPTSYIEVKLGKDSI